MRLVEQDALEVQVLGEDRRDQAAAPSADVDDRLHAREVVAPGDQLRMGGRVAEHALVEQGRDLWVLREVVEQALAVDMVERRLARTHAVQQVAPGPPVRVVELEQDG